MQPWKIILVILMPLFFFSGCKEDDPEVGDVDITIDFRAEFGGEDLEISSVSYDYPTGEKLKMLLFQYYVSDVELLPADGGEAVKLSDIELLRWESASQDALQSLTFTVPAGDYVGLRFGLGVSPDLNAKDPNEFSADYPLNENEFWNADARYVFAKIEANADLNADGMYDTPLTYHMGSNPIYTTLTFTTDFTFDGSNDPRLTVVAVVLKALSDDNSTFDISNPNQQRVHGGNQAIATSIWSRLLNQFVLEMR